MGQAWYDYPVGLAHGAGMTNPKTGEMGIDIGMPLGTPITALYAGKVNWAGRTDWGGGRTSGGMVSIVSFIPDVPNNVGPPYSPNPTSPGTYTQYYMHLDTAAVKQGDEVSAGQIIGTSGGQNTGGNWPTSPGYSNFLHIEFGFNAYWVSGPGRNIDPTWAINAARKGTLPATAPNGTYALTSDLAVGAGAGQPVSGTNPGIYDTIMLNFAGISTDVHKTITQPAGWDGLCEWLQSAQALPDWNWRNPIGSLMESFMPAMLRIFFISIGGAIILAVIWSWVRGPVLGIGESAASAAIPAAPVLGAAGAAPAAGAARQGLAAAPAALAK